MQAHRDGIGFVVVDVDVVVVADARKARLSMELETMVTRSSRCPPRLPLGLSSTLPTLTLTPIAMPGHASEADRTTGHRVGPGHAVRKSLRSGLKTKFLSPDLHVPLGVYGMESHRDHKAISFPREKIPDLTSRSRSRKITFCFLSRF